jgi:hypothetical protein
VTTSTLLAASNFLGSHFITASYSGDAHFPATSASLVQKVHANSTTTTLSSAVNLGTNSVMITAAIAPQSTVTNVPTGMVSIWDGADFLAQLPLNNSGLAITNWSLTPGSHALNARYESDTVSAASSGSVLPVPTAVSATVIGVSGGILLAFTNNSGTPFEVLSATNLSRPLPNWAVLGQAREETPGQYRFFDSVPATNQARFYSVRSP